jgi:hypothetical protein
MLSEALPDDYLVLRTMPNLRKTGRSNAMLMSNTWATATDGELLTHFHS